MSEDQKDIHSAKQLAEDAPEKSRARKMADIAGKAASAQQLAQLAEALDGQTTVSADEIAKLIDETMPSDPVGIALALEYKIKEQGEKVKSLAAKLDKAREDVKMLAEVDRENHEDYAKDILKVNNDISEAHLALSESIPFSIFPDDGILLHSVLVGTPHDPQDMPRDYRSEIGTDLGGTNPILVMGKTVYDPEAAKDFMSALDGLSWKESCELRDAIRNLKTLTIHRNQIENFHALHIQAHPAIAKKAERLVTKLQEEYDTAVGELHVAVACRAAETGVAQPVPAVAPSPDKTSGKEVYMSGTASIGQIKATASAVVQKGKEETDKQLEAINAEKIRWDAQEREVNADKEAVNLIKQMVQGVRIRANLPAQDIIDWKQTIRRSRDGTDAMHLAANTLNDMMPGLINSKYEWKFFGKHGREMLALRKGIVLPYGPLTCHVTDRFDPEGNELLCFLPDYGVFAMIAPEVKNHGELKIKTVKNEEEKNWTYFEENTEGVPKNVKNLKGVKLEEYAAYYKLIMAHINAKNPLIDAS